MRRVVRPYWCVLLQLSILGNPALVSYAFTILPEALFVTAVMVYCVLALRFISRPISGTAMALGAVSMAIALLISGGGQASVDRALSGGRGGRPGGRR